MFSQQWNEAQVKYTQNLQDWCNTERGKENFVQRCFLSVLTSQSTPFCTGTSHQKCTIFRRLQRLLPVLSDRLFTDAAQIVVNGFTKKRNLHSWAQENQHHVTQCHLKQRFSVNGLFGVSSNKLIGRHVIINGSYFQKFSGMRIVSVFSGCASCNTRTNVAPKWRSTSTFCSEATEFLNEYCKGRRIGDGLEQMDRCINPLDYPTWTQTISSCGVVWSRDCIIVGSRKKVSVSLVWFGLVSPTTGSRDGQRGSG